MRLPDRIPLRGRDQQRHRLVVQHHPQQPAVPRHDAVEHGAGAAVEPALFVLVLVLEQAGRHLLLLIDDVLDLSRVESGRVPLSIESVELAPLIEEAASSQRASNRPPGTRAGS